VIGRKMDKSSRSKVLESPVGSSPKERRRKQGEKISDLHKFQKAFDKGREGKVDSYQIWLKSHGIDPIKVEYENIRAYLDENLEYTQNRLHEITSIAEFIGFFTRERKDLYHIPVIGLSGVGKTHFLINIQHLIEKIEIKLHVKFIDLAKLSKNLHKEFEDNQEIKEEEIFNVFKKNNAISQKINKTVDVLLIDSCDWTNPGLTVPILNLLNHFKKEIQNGVIISTWTPDHWLEYKYQVEEIFLPVTKEIYLNFLNEDAIDTMIGLIADYLGINNTIDKVFLSEINQFSKGIPKVAILLLLESIKASYYNNRDVLDHRSIKEAALKMGISLDFDVFLGKGPSRFQQPRISILRHILLGRNRPKELVTHLGKNKATINYHLKNLVERGILISNRVGRAVYYDIKEEIKPFIQDSLWRNLSKWLEIEMKRKEVLKNGMLGIQKDRKENDQTEKRNEGNVNEKISKEKR